MKIPINNETEYIIFSIDPGINNVGIAITSANFKDLSINTIISFSITPDESVDDIYAYSHNEQFYKIYSITQQILSYIKRFNPKVVICENPFFNPKRPNSFEPLVQSVFAIRLAIAQYSPRLKFISYQPRHIKTMIGMTDKLDKLTVLFALQKIEEISNKINLLDNLYDQHSVDAIAIGYTHLLNLRRMR